MPLVGQRLMQTFFQVYLLKNNGAAGKKLWVAKYIYTIASYIFLFQFYLSHSDRTASNYVHLVTLWLLVEFTSVVVETLYYDIYWLAFYK